MDYRNRQVVVTGGTGALGTAVVGALIKAGATCHVPYLIDQEAARFPFRDHAQVKLVADMDLAEESAVARLFEGVPALWASIHLVGGFAMAPIGKTSKADLMKQVDMNFVTAFLCCRAAVNAMTRTGAGGRIVNVATRPALEWRAGAGMVAYVASKAAVAALTVALAEEVVRRTSWSTRSRPRPWTRRRTGRRCPRPISTPGPRSRTWRRRSCSWPRRKTASPAAAWCRCMEKASDDDAGYLPFAPAGTASRAGVRTSLLTALAATTWRCCAKASWFFSMSSRS